MNESKRQNLPAGLWVVATPIGNLGDLTSRAEWALRSADWILCEDTRRTAALLTSLGLKQFSSKLERFDAYAGVGRVLKWVEELKNGKSIALVTDAGTPAISDPGSILVSHAANAGIRVTPIPGVSALTALLSIAGFNQTSFAFRGFFPRKLKEQKEELSIALNSNLTQLVVWYESPLRIRDTLNLISEEHPDVKMVVGKELTKLHENIFYGSSVEVKHAICQELDTEGEVGEWCFVIEFKKPEKLLTEDHSWNKALECLSEAEISTSHAAKLVSQKFGISKKEVYEAALKVFGKKNAKGG